MAEQGDGPDSTANDDEVFLVPTSVPVEPNVRHSVTAVVVGSRSDRFVF
jgi:hypothetical protein